MTKRLFAYLGITMLCTYTAVFYFEFWGGIAACAAAAVFFICAFLYRGRNKNKSACVLISLVIIVSLIVFNCYDISFRADAQKYDGKTVRVSAEALENGYENYGKYYYELKTDKIDGNNESVKLLLQTNYDIGLRYRDKIEAILTLKAYDKGYYLSRKYVCRAYSEDFELDCSITKVEEKGIGYIPIMLREKLVRALRGLLPGIEGEMCAAMTFGVRNELNKEVYGLVTKSGLSFFVVVSGLHMSIIAIAIMYLLRPLGRNRRLNLLRCGLAVFGILIYMGITGFTPSVVRSGIMIILTLIGTGMFRQSDCYNNLGLAAFVLTVLNPYAVGDAGLLLSFASVFGILYLRPLIAGGTISAIDAKTAESERLLKATNVRSRIISLRLRIILNKTTRTLLEAFAVSMSATAAVIPVTLLLFGTANPFVFVFGVVLSPVVTVMIIFSLIAAVSCFVPLVNSVSFVLAFPAWLCCTVFLRITGTLSQVSWWTVYIERDIVFAVAAATLVLAAGILIFTGKPNFVIPVLTALILLITCCVSVRMEHSSSLELRLLNAGRGTVIQLSGSGAEAVLDFSGKPFADAELFEKLRNRAGDVSAMELTDDSMAVCRAGVSLINEFDVKTILLYHSDKTAQDLAEKAEYADNYLEINGGETMILNFGSGVKDTVVHTGKYIWHYLRAGKHTLLIVPRGGNTDALDAQYRSADCLIAGGEITSPEMLDYERCIWLSESEPPKSLEKAEKVFGRDCCLDLK